MLKRRAARVVTTGLLLVVPVVGLTACRTSPNVAAYVGDTQVTVAEVEAAVAQRTSDETVAAVADGDPEAFTRRVLTLLVQEEVHSQAAERYGIAVDGDDVRAETEQLLGGDDPDTIYADLAQRGIARADVFATVHQRLIRQGIAETEGRVEELGAPELQAQYEEVKQQYAEFSFGYIAVPDEATATSVLGRLTAAPASYASIAAQYPGTFTLPALEVRGPDELPSVLAEGITAAEAGSGFTVPVAETGGVVVAFVEGIVYPSFEEVRPQLEASAADAVQQAGAELVSGVQEDLGVTVNPRFGVLDEGQLVDGGRGVVELLGDDADAQAAE